MKKFFYWIRDAFGFKKCFVIKASNCDTTTSDAALRAASAAPCNAATIPLLRVENPQVNAMKMHLFCLIDIF